MSEFKFACPVCGQHIKSHSRASGTQIECPTCFQKIVVPQAPTGDSAKYILSAAQAPGKRPVTGITDAPPTVRSRPFWPQLLGALLAAAVLAAAALALVKSGVRKPPAPPPPPARSNLVRETTPAPVAPDPRWRLNLTGVDIPTNAASGRIWGRSFQLQRATFQNGTLALRQGPTWPPDVGVTIVLPKRPAEDYAGKHFFIPADYAGPAPRVVLRTKDEQQRELTTNFRSGYALKLEFGQIADGKLPGRVYLCLTDHAQSVVVGSFLAEIRRPPPR
jgi:DNA-directed RNA polymerase subunit RPC12/RpoP